MKKTQEAKNKIPTLSIKPPIISLFVALIISISTFIFSIVLFSTGNVFAEFFVSLFGLFVMGIWFINYELEYIRKILYFYFVQNVKGGINKNGLPSRT